MVDGRDREGLVTARKLAHEAAGRPIAMACRRPPVKRDITDAHRDGLPLRPRRHAGRQRLPARAGLEGGARRGGDRPLGLAHPSPHRHERRAVHEPAPARDQCRHHAPSGSSVFACCTARPTNAMRRRSGRCRARSSCSARSRKTGSPGRSQPAGGWRRLRSISRHSASTPRACPSSRATRCATPSRIPTCSWPPPPGSTRRSNIP